MINDQLHGHDGIDFGRIATLISNRIAQARKINKRGLPKNVVTHHPRRKPREIKITFALDELLQIIRELLRIGFAQQIFSVHACGVGELVVGSG